MLLTSTETALRIEEADILHLSRQVIACTSLFPSSPIISHTVGGGIAAATLPIFGRKLNKIVGFGLHRPVSRHDLLPVEALYSSLGLQTEVVLCPYADPTALTALAEGGYVVDGFVNAYARALTDEDLVEGDEYGEIEVCRVMEDNFDEFVKSSVAGFASGGRPRELLETLARIATMRADTRLYFALIDGKIAGSAGLALMETSKGRVAELYIDSTMPEYRGRGVQVALSKARLAEARKEGYDFATVQARQSNGSARNAERAGFGLAYCKPTFSKKTT